ncbi:F-type H+-transporting ATPase subunit epsilon [Tamaricihabitans halophyticus]|uniref:ATP synthase epsilon chain n=1 Tax=Tamaricihabitans halophyticus TaxID=1262583 RepID=A0A4R2R5G6_9PSEU|nr:F0F1 ATP synthase subunit epsilon [Tamaricihabitans halophyticus]TCP54821.1 F-type H+-transporting ATPase subunit epsilon [Tamaricihabitans halophyticus]
MAEIAVELVAVERRLWSGKASFVVAETTEGQIGLLPGHEPMLGQLVEGGIVRVTTVDGDVMSAAVHGGFLSVTGDGVSVLAESADLADEIDVAAARAALTDEDATERARAAGRLRAAGQSA